MKLFLDVNIVIDFLANRTPHGASAKELFRLIEHEVYEAYVSTISFATANYLLGLYGKKGKELAELRKLNTLVRVAVVTEKCLDQALNGDAFPDVEDGMQYFAAIAAGCEMIISRDATGFASSSIPVLTAEQFLAEVGSG